MSETGPGATDPEAPVEAEEDALEPPEPELPTALPADPEVPEADALEQAVAAPLPDEHDL